MPVWNHLATAPIGSSPTDSNCVFCRAPLAELEQEPGSKATTYPGYYILRTRVQACNRCGWWRVIRKSIHHNGYRTIHFDAGIEARLKELDLNDISLQTEEIRDFLCARYDARFEIHPRKLEEVVGSVFKDVGYSASVTAYSGDGGIDVILRGSEGTIGVQVKRYRNSIQVEQIRALAGALVLNDLTRGVFVTTSAYQAGATDTAKAYAERGLPIELLDAAKFFDLLEIAQRERYRYREDIDPERYEHALSQAPAFGEQMSDRTDDFD